MIRHVLLDAGPLAAIVNPREVHHEWVRLQLAEIVPPLITCESVLSEACFLARRADGGMADVLSLVERRVIVLAWALNEHLGEVSVLMHRYANVPMSLADACLVRMSEVVPDCVLLTLDHDFEIYRRNRRQKIPLLIPSEDLK